jgi:hypothetical protein
MPCQLEKGEKYCGESRSPVHGRGLLTPYDKQASGGCEILDTGFSGHQSWELWGGLIREHDEGFRRLESRNPGSLPEQQWEHQGTQANEPFRTYISLLPSFFSSQEKE